MTIQYQGNGVNTLKAPYTGVAHYIKAKGNQTIDNRPIDRDY